MIRSLPDKRPSLDAGARIASSATLVGDVCVDSGVSIWYGAVLRGDECAIRVGAGSNIQDQAVIHGDAGTSVRVGRDVTVGHAAILHGCTVEDSCIIGMGAILMDGSLIGSGSLVGAGALVTRNTIVPPGSLVMGSPAKIVRPLTQEEAATLSHSAQTYRALAAAQLPLAQAQEELL